MTALALQSYRTKKALTEAVQGLVNAQPFDTAFAAPLITDLIAERHYYCAPMGWRPLQFRKRAVVGMGSYLFEGEFPAPVGWHGVSWRKCIYPPADGGTLAAGARVSVRPVVRAYHDAHPVCERCEAVPSTAVDHVDPEFKALLHTVLEHAPWDQQASLLASFDWIATEQYVWPHDHPLTVALHAAHERAILQAVCAGCHVQNAAERRRP